MGILVAYLLGFVTAISSRLQIKSVYSQIKEVNSNSDIGKTPEIPAPRIAPELAVPETVSHQEKSRTKRNKVPDWLKFFVNLATLTAVIWYACEARKQRVAMDNTFTQIQQQTTLMRQQLVGTQGAIIEPSIPTWNEIRQEVSLTFANRNQNGVTGKIRAFKALLQRKTWPGNKPIGTAIPYDVPDVTLQRGGQWGYQKHLPWPLSPTIKDTSKWPGTEYVTFEGSYVYENGFGDLVPFKFCFLWLPIWSEHVPSHPEIGANGGQWSGGAEGCPPIPEKIIEFKGHWERLQRLTKEQH
jgi:hypothetical protein